MQQAHHGDGPADQETRSHPPNRLDEHPMCPGSILPQGPAPATCAGQHCRAPEMKSPPRTDGSGAGRNSIAKDVSESSSLCSVRNFPDPEDSSVHSGAGRFLGDRHPAVCQGYAPQGRGTGDRRAGVSPRKRDHHRAAKRKPRPSVPGNRPEPIRARGPPAPPAGGLPSAAHRPAPARAGCHFQTH